MLLSKKLKAYAFTYVSQARLFFDISAHGTAPARNVRWAELAVTVRSQGAVSTKLRKRYGFGEIGPRQTHEQILGDPGHSEQKPQATTLWSRVNQWKSPPPRAAQMQTRVQRARCTIARSPCMQTSEPGVPGSW